MLVTLKEVLDLCEARECAVGSFNTPNLEAVIAVIKAAEELNVPVIIQHAQVHEELMPLKVIGPIMLEQAKKAKVPVVAHIDHGETLDYIYQALDMGFTSVMYDGSTLPFAENAANTKLAAAMAKSKGASVEGEIGSMGRRETGEKTSAEPDPDKIYTDPDEAKIFVEQTGIDALACSFGTTHGVYVTEPKLDFTVVENVRRKCKIPVVMHGGSGISAEDFQKAIKAGVRKINYYTYMAMAGGKAVADQLCRKGTPIEKDGISYSLVRTDDAKPIMYHDIGSWGIEAMKENCKKAMGIFDMR